MERALIYDQFDLCALLAQDFSVFAANVKIVEVIFRSHEGQNWAARGLGVLRAPAVEHDVQRKFTTIGTQNSGAITLKAGVHCSYGATGKTDYTNVPGIDSGVLPQYFERTE